MKTNLFFNPCISRWISWENNVDARRIFLVIGESRHHGIKYNNDFDLSNNTKGDKFVNKLLASKFKFSIKKMFFELQPISTDIVTINKQNRDSSSIVN